MARTLRHLVVLLVLPVAFAGCAFNLGCELFGSVFQRQLPQVDVCGSFNGECCGDNDGDGFPEECSGILGFPPCARFDTDECFCTTGGFGLIGQTLLPEPAAYSLPPNTSFFISLPYAGLSGGHRAFVDTVAQDLQTRQAVITYPDAFGFNGFLALGPAQTVIGALGVDFDFDFDPDLTLPLRALTADTAYVDGNLDGRFTAADPQLVHTIGSHVFTLTLPRGGDGLARTKVGRLGLKLTIALYGGLLVNPTTPDDYAITAAFTSVDPDSGDTDDGVNVAPTSFATPPETVTIFAPSFGALSPFLCYATKPSKGTLCASTAAANAGGACTTVAECGGTAGACVKSPLAKNLPITVQDDFNFTTQGYTIAKPASLCTPAEVNGDGPPADAAAHLRGYQVKAAKGSPKPDPVQLSIATDLGIVHLETKKPDRLLVTSAKVLDAPAAPLGATDVDDLQCYTVKLLKKRCAENLGRKCKKSADCGVDGPCLTAFPKNLTVQVGDQFTGFPTPRTLTVVKPTRLCFAADVNGGGVTNFGASLLCYQAKPGPGVAKHGKIVGRIHTTNPLARERADTTKESEICLPSLFAGAS